MRQLVSVGGILLTVLLLAAPASADQMAMIALEEGEDVVSVAAAAASPDLLLNVAFERAGLLPGRDLNGRDLNPAVAGGQRLAAVWLPGALMAWGLPLAAGWLEETRLHGIDIYGGGVALHDFVGSYLDASLEDGSPVVLRIEALFPHPAPIHGDVLLYEVSYATREGWEPLCGIDDEGAPIAAIPLEGAWNYGEGVPGGGEHVPDPFVFTFACQRYVLAKCVEAGYKPWQGVIACPGGVCDVVSLAGHHQACTRMMRADYCGDGTSYTFDGTLVNFYDDVGVRMDSETWDLEAEWAPDGALCLDSQRIQRFSVHCGPDLAARGCGIFGDGALLLSEVEPAQP